MKENTSFEFNFVEVVSLIWKHKTKIIIACVVAAVLSAIFSGPFFITPKYKAQVIFYPTTINSIGNALFTDLNKREADLLSFGEEEEAEYALQLLSSSSLQQRIVKNYDLMNHYNIDPNGKSPNMDLADMMRNNIEFRRTRHLAVEITVMDEDPEKAAEIANGIGAIYDTVKTEIQHQVALDALKVVEEQYQAKAEEVMGLRSSLKELGANGVTNFEEQSRALAEEIYKARGNPALVNQLKEEQATLAKYAGEFTYLNETLILELESLSQLRKRYEKASVDVEKTLPQKFILTSAQAPEKKAYPIRSLIVIMVTGATGFLSVLLVLLLKQFGRAKE